MYESETAGEINKMELLATSCVRFYTGVGLSFKGNENHWPEAGGSKSLQSRKCHHHRKTSVRVVIGKMKATASVSLLFSVFIGYRCGRAIPPASNTQTEASTCVSTSLTKS